MSLPESGWPQHLVKPQSGPGVCNSLQGPGEGGPGAAMSPARLLAGSPALRGVSLREAGTRAGSLVRDCPKQLLSMASHPSDPHSGGSPHGSKLGSLGGSEAVTDARTCPGWGDSLIGLEGLGKTPLGILGGTCSRPRWLFGALAALAGRGAQVETTAASPWAGSRCQEQPGPLRASPVGLCPAGTGRCGANSGSVRLRCK